MNSLFRNALAFLILSTVIVYSAACGVSGAETQFAGDPDRPLVMPATVAGKPKIVALGDSLTAGFGLTVEGIEGEIPAVAIAMRAGYQIDADALGRNVIEKLDSASRPRVVRLMNELPTTAGDRVLKSALRGQGIPVSDSETRP